MSPKTTRSRKRRCFDRWSAFRSLAGAWERLQRKKLAPGSDQVSQQGFRERAVVELDALYDELRTGRYRPIPLRCFVLEQGGKRRELSIPALRDRVVQEAIRPLLQEAMQPELSPACHGYVKGRSVLTAQHAAAAAVATGRTWLHRTDIQDGFGSVDRRLMRAAVAELLDPATGDVVDRILGAKRSRRGRIDPPGERGIPLGQPLSPPCFNVLLLPLDRALEEAEITFVRYADDVLLLGRSPGELDRGLGALNRSLADLGMRRNPRKDRRTEVQGDPFEFLGRFLAGGHVLEAVHPPSSKSRTETTVPDERSGLASMDPAQDALPPLKRTLYLQTDGAWVRVRKGQAVVQRGSEERQRVPLREVDRVVVLAAVSFSAPFLAACMERSIPVHFVMTRRRGPVFGTLVRSDGESALRVRSQLESHGDASFRLELARAMVIGKIANSRWLLLRLRCDRATIRSLGKALGRAKAVESLDELLGAEGHAAALHFRALGKALRQELGFEGRKRRPPRDPFNSMLSFGYTLLFNEVHSLIIQAGLSPFIGYLHALRDNHPALASDLIEELRSPIVDRFCLRLANLRQLKKQDFEERGTNRAVLLKDEARRRYLELWEGFLSQPLCRTGDGRLLDARRLMDRQVRRLRDCVLDPSVRYLPFDAAKEARGKAAGDADADHGDQRDRLASRRRHSLPHEKTRPDERDHIEAPSGSFAQKHVSQTGVKQEHEQEKRSK